MARTTPRRSVLADALQHAFSPPGDASLVEPLVHPGLLAGAQPPPAEAPHGEHIRAALVALARIGRRKLSIEGGRPASTWAWAFVIEDELALSPESDEHDDEWTVALDEGTVAAAADRLTALLHGEHGRSPLDPLFITCMPLRPGDAPLPH